MTAKNFFRIVIIFLLVNFQKGEANMKQEIFALKGNIFYSTDSKNIKAVEHGYLIISEGKVEGVFESLPEKFSKIPVKDYGEDLIIPGMTDLHVHAPQFPFRGIGMDLELLDWLNTYTFPEEIKYKNLEYAEKVYKSFAEALKASPTTRAVIFGTIHLEASKLLMNKLEDTGLITYVGKVNMDRNSPDNLKENTSDRIPFR